MKRKAIILGLVIILLLSHIFSLNAQEQEEYLTWLDGNDYLEMPKELRIIYIGGLLDMFYFLNYLEFPEIYKNIYAKMKDMSLKQMTKILDKYLEEYPENLHYSTADSFYNAISELFDKE
jgi:hypothetical protein